MITASVASRDPIAETAHQQPARKRRPWGRWVRQGANWAALGVITFILLVPIIWMIAYSFAPVKGMGSGASLFPPEFRIEGFLQVFAQTPFFRWLANSVFVSTIQTAAQLVIAFLAAFALAHFSFKGRTAIFYFALATMVIPSQTMMIPTFITINSLGWINTYAGVIVPSLASGYAIFLLRQFFIGVPRALIDSARVDGCGEPRILLHIYLPLSVPVIMALASISSSITGTSTTGPSRLERQGDDDLPRTGALRNGHHRMGADPRGGKLGYRAGSRPLLLHAEKLRRGLQHLGNQRLREGGRRKAFENYRALRARNRA